MPRMAEDTIATLPTVGELARELVAAYDALDIAMRVAMVFLEGARPTVTEQYSFWVHLKDLDRVLEQVLEASESLETWIWLEYEKRVDSPLTTRRADVEGYRRAFYEKSQDS